MCTGLHIMSAMPDRYIAIATGGHRTDNYLPHRLLLLCAKLNPRQAEWRAPRPSQNIGARDSPVHCSMKNRVHAQSHNFI
jgi:hypothetical protein